MFDSLYIIRSSALRTGILSESLDQFLSHTSMSHVAIHRTCRIETYESCMITFPANATNVSKQSRNWCCALFSWNIRLLHYFTLTMYIKSPGTYLS